MISSTDCSTSRPGSDALAVARENVDAQLFFQLDDRLRNPGLRGKQRFGGVGQVVVLAHGLAHEAQLMEVHSGNILVGSANSILRCLFGLRI